jgi:hypothetical protein
MNTTEDPLTPQRLRTMQIIATVLPGGVIVFLAIVLYLVHVQNQGHGMAPPVEVPLLSLLAVGFLGVVAVLSFVLPASTARTGIRDMAARPPAADAVRLLGLYQTTLIVGLALLEGGCFFGCIAYMQEGRPFVLAVLAVGLALILMRFPTEGRVRLWLEDHKEQLARARQEAGARGPGT